MNFLEFLTLPARERREELGNFVGGLFATPEQAAELRQPFTSPMASNYQNSFLARNAGQTPASVQFLRDYGDFLPVIGDFAGAADVAQELTSENPNYPLAAALGAATAVGAVPYVGDLAARGISSGAKSLFDVANRLEFDPSTVGSNLGNVRLKPRIETRDGEKILEELKDVPTAKGFTTDTPQIPMSNTANIDSQKPIALSQHKSVVEKTGEGVAPTVREGIDNLQGKTVLSIVGDQTGRQDVISVNDLKFDKPVRSYAGFEFSDIKGQGYAGDKGPTSSKLNEAERILDAGGDPYVMSVLMGEKSSDFAMHTGDVYGQMFTQMHNKIDPKDYKFLNDKIRNMSAQIGGKTIYPYKDFPDVADPKAMTEYLNFLPSGTLRAEFIKSLDKAWAYNKGLPKPSDARLAVADLKQYGMDWGTVGYRGFTPDVEKGVFEATPEMSTTYQAVYDKVGEADTYLNESMGVPANLLFRNMSENQRLASGGKRGGLMMDSAVYKQLEMSPKAAQQTIEQIDVDTVNTFLDVEKTQGRDRAYQFAQKVLSAGKVTNELIKQAKKMNAPTWVVALMVSQQAMQGDE